MTRYLLDTDMFTLYHRGHAAVTREVIARPPGQVAISVISVEEQLTGWYTRVRRAKKSKELAEVYRRFANAVRFLAGLSTGPGATKNWR